MERVRQRDDQLDHQMQPLKIWLRLNELDSRRSHLLQTAKGK